MKILTIPSPILYQPVKPVLKIDKKIHQLVKEMTEVLNKQVDPPGVGLAAPQVGVSLALFISKPTKKVNPQVFINPKIVKVKQSYPRASQKLVNANSTDVTNSTKRHVKLEGCLSIPRIWSPVLRAQKILLNYQTLSGERKTQWFSGFPAVVIQHEIDHLKGILFTQRAIEQNAPLFEESSGKLKKIELK